MILRLNGNINRYYVQTLCLVFFPGSTFGLNEESRPGVPEIDISVHTTDDGSCVAEARILLNDKESSARVVLPADTVVTISTPETLAVGRALFAAGKDILGHIPPWGILTGVRPAKIAGDLLREGRGINKSKRILRDEYFLNPQKAALAVSVASNEIKLLKKMDINSCSLYISIPFCPSRCSYCSFVSYTTPRLLSMIDGYIDALLVDMDETFDIIKDLGMRISSIYIGGGTPTTLDTGNLKRIFKKIKDNVDLSSIVEFTLEAGRPDTITREKLKLAKEYGVTRVSVNPQTLNDDILRDIGRRHSVEDFYRAFELARESGIRDINVDLIAGLPGDDFMNFSLTIDKIIELAPTNITVHTFCVKKASDALRNNADIYSVFGGDAAKCVSYSQLKTKFAGYKPYYMYRQKNTVGNLENVGFSLDGHEGIYNVFMMEEVQTIFAVGAGSVTKLVDTDTPTGEKRILRMFKPKYPFEYLRDFENKDKCDGSYKNKVLDFFNNKE